MGVGYRYLSLSQCVLLIRQSGDDLLDLLTKALVVPRHSRQIKLVDELAVQAHFQDVELLDLVLGCLGSTRDSRHRAWRSHGGTARCAG